MMIRPHLASFGITRVGELTGLDDIGIPIAMTVRPNSKTLSVSLGKGADVDSAVISAIMEAVETAVAEELPDNLTRAAYKSHDRAFLSGMGFGGISRCHSQLINDEEPIDWYPCKDILTDRTTLVPWALVGMDHRVAPAGYHDAFYVASDGLASGFQECEAIFHGLCELIERDAYAALQLMPRADILKRKVKVTGAENPKLPALLSLIDEAQQDLTVIHMPTNLGVPAFMAVIEARHHRHGVSEHKAQCGGCGCHPDPGTAILQAITEAAQARLALVAGTRDDISNNDYQEKPSAWLAGPQPPVLSLPDEDVRGFVPCGYGDAIERLLASLMRTGVRSVFCARLPVPQLDLCVVRVIADGLQVPLSGHRVQVTQRCINMLGDRAA
jgi:YcaO-like protein with predicted kinase domain